MNSFFYLLPLGLALLFASCKSKDKVASSNPYQNNPYYGASGNTTNYSSTPSNSSYPSYAESTYTPPSSVPGPSVPNVPSVPTYSGSNSAPVSYSGSGSGSYTVASGDTLYGIARKNGTSVNALKSANGLSSDTIRIGQRLVIP